MMVHFLKLVGKKLKSSFSNLNKQFITRGVQNKQNSKDKLVIANTFLSVDTIKKNYVI